MFRRALLILSKSEVLLKLTLLAFIQSQQQIMTKLISTLIAVIVALFPILMLHSVNHIMAIIADVLLLFFAAALHSDNPKDKEPAIIFAAILISIISQIAWALLV